MSADDFILAPAVDKARPDIPGYNVSIKVERHQRKVGNGVEDAICLDTGRNAGPVTSIPERRRMSHCPQPKKLRRLQGFM